MAVSSGCAASWPREVSSRRMHSTPRVRRCARASRSLSCIATARETDHGCREEKDCCEKENRGEENTGQEGREKDGAARAADPPTERGRHSDVPHWSRRLL